MNKGYTITKVKHGGSAWMLPADLMKQFSLTENEPVMLRCGSALTQAQVLSFKNSVPPGASIMGLSPDTLQALGIPANISLNIKKAGEKEFRLGPVIATLTFPFLVPQKLGYYKAYSSLIKNGGLYYVFRSQGINAAQRTITGYYYNYTEKSWQAREFPFPDAVMDRRYPNSGPAHGILEKVIGPHRIFNKKTMITKLDFERALRGDHLLAGHIPETREFRSIHDLTYFLAKYGKALLKPTNAMKGSGIVAVKTSAGGLECSYTKKGESHTKVIPSAYGIFGLLKSVAGRIRPYIVQQVIDCVKYKGESFSFRTCPMKNGKGHWVMPGMLALGAVGNSFVTNYSAGGRRIPLKNLFGEIEPQLPYKRDRLLGILEDITLKTAEALDKKHGPLGDLGIDIIIEKGGKLWLLEANGNPGRAPIYVQREYPAWPAQLYKYPIEYAVHLAGFG